MAETTTTTTIDPADDTTTTTTIEPEVAEKPKIESRSVQRRKAVQGEAKSKTTESEAQTHESRLEDAKQEGLRNAAAERESRPVGSSEEEVTPE